MLVEDEDLRGVVIGVMRHHLGAWAPIERQEEWPAHITVANSADEVLNENGLVAQLQETGVKAVGIIVDANASFQGRWERIRGFCRKHGANVPAVCPQNGLIVGAILGARFGAWIMPNNRDNGMVENFCKELVPHTENEALWAYAKNSANHARENVNAPFIEAHIHKAQMHTWLAWQDPPGERMGSAIRKRILKAELGWGGAFSGWFRELFGV
jgi:hypothetical protein